MSEELQEIAQQAASYKALKALMQRWSDEADRLLRTDGFTQPYPLRALLREIAEAQL